MTNGKFSEQRKNYFSGIHNKLLLIGCLISFILCSSSNASASLPSPSLNCISVTDSGYANLTWTPVSDSAACFHAYYIYHSTKANGPYTVIDSIFNINQGNYTDNNADANNQISYYYIRTVTTCGKISISPPRDTLSSILVTVTPQIGTALVTWNSPFINSHRLPASTYQLWREFPKNNWLNIASVPINFQLSDNKYIDTIAACNSYIYYRIEIADTAAGCTSVSSVGGALFHDVTAPPTVVIDTVSIDSVTKKTIISWFPSGTKDVDAYIIYKCTNNICSPFDTIVGIDSSYYVNPNSSPYSGSETYTVAALDSCNNKGPYSLPHNTLFLTASIDICKASITLNWNPYINMNSLKGYRVYYSMNNGPFSLLSTVTAPAPGTPIPTTYVHTNVLTSTNYCYYVQAFDSTNHRTSSSNIRCVVSILSLKPKFAYIRYATVVPDPSGTEHVDVRFIADSSAYVSKYVILRADSLNGVYAPVTTISNSNIHDITYSDMNVTPDKQSYSYKVEVFDSCGNLATTSNPARTIFLFGKPNTTLSNHLTWNPYVLWFSSVTGYNVYRQLNPNSVLPPPFTLLGNVPPVPPLNYDDDVTAFSLDEGNFAYYVEAIEDKDTIYGFQDSSRSNTVLVSQEPKYYVPNAFNPFGNNTVFTPVGVFNNPKGYYFAVFNRWGAKMFETTVPNKGWNGYFNGKLAPMGTYVYILQYEDNQGISYFKKGSVTLLR